MRKVPNKRCFRVSNRKSKRVMSKCSTKANAEKQLRLLRAVENNKNFVPYGSRKSKKYRGGETESEKLMSRLDNSQNNKDKKSELKHLSSLLPRPSPKKPSPRKSLSKTVKRWFGL